MSREIKFRGRAVANYESCGVKIGDFVIGCFIKSDCDAPCIVLGNGKRVDIDIETLGQYTDIKDWGGLEVYEGDIVREFNGDKLAAIYFCSLTAGFMPGAITIGTLVGNIHENPELLEKSK